MTDFIKKIYEKKWTKIIASLFLAMVGNALWDYFGRQTVSFIGETVIKAIGFFNSTTIDSLYINAARNETTHETLIYIGIVMVINFIGLLLALKIYTNMRFFRTEDIIESLKSNLDNLDQLFPEVVKDESKTQSLEEREKELKEKIVEYKKSIATVEKSFKHVRKETNKTLIILFAIFFIIVLQHSRTMYVQNIITSYKQLLTICSPAMKDIQIKQLNSKFSSMKSKRDFEEIKHQLREIAENNSLDLSYF